MEKQPLVELQRGPRKGLATLAQVIGHGGGSQVVDAKDQGKPLLLPGFPLPAHSAECGTEGLHLSTADILDWTILHGGGLSCGFLAASLDSPL